MLIIGCAGSRTLADTAWCCCLLIIFYILSTSVVWAQPQSVPAQDHANISIETLLQNYIQNGSRQLYEGTFVYLFEDQVKTIKVRRTVNDQGQVAEEFISQDDDQKNNSRILSNHFCLLDNGWRYHFQPVFSSFPFMVNNTLEVLQKNYNFSISKPKIVAGNTAVGVSIEAKDPYRYGYQLWFDPDTSTLLKYKLVNQKGKVIEQYLFTDISLKHSPAQQSANSSYHQNPNQSVLCKQRFSGLSDAFKQFFLADKVPDGYEAISYRQAVSKQSEFQAGHFQLSDGLASVSVFIEDGSDVHKKIKGVIKMGPMSVAGKTVGKHQITVIGAIPVDSALQFVNAIRPSLP